MIADILLDVPSGVKQLHESPFDFQLTGSRFFGNDRPDSDWDFFVESSRDVAEYLLKNGYQNQPANFQDDEIHDIFTKGNNSQKIEVILVKDLTLRRHAQTLIKSVFPNGINCDEDIRSNIWVLTCKSLRERVMLAQSN